MSRYSTISDAAAALRAGETTSFALASDAIEVADTYDEAVGTFIVRYTEQALMAAEAADTAFASGIDKGFLQGIPLGIKDIITTKEGPSTAQSLVLDPQWGLDLGDAVVVSRLREAGALIMGKLTTSEFAIGVPDFDRPFPIPRNPWNLDYWPGGSSSGSGSGVASGMVLGALGTDAGGSIRIPASFCGICGLMPTFGRVPKSGCTPLGYSLDHIGPLTRTARDAALMLSVIAGVDASDPCSVDVSVPDYLGELTGDLSALRIGVQRLDQYANDEDPALVGCFSDAVATLAAAGADVIEVQLPFYNELTAACLLMFVAEAVAYHMPDMQRRWADYSPGTREDTRHGLLAVSRRLRPGTARSACRTKGSHRIVRRCRSDRDSYGFGRRHPHGSTRPDAGERPKRTLHALLGQHRKPCDLDSYGLRRRRHASWLTDRWAPIRRGRGAARRRRLSAAHGLAQV